MPFTLAHPAIVLPFNRLQQGWVSLTGLVVGSLSPDFEYLLRMRPVNIHSHTIGGVFWYDLPLALITCFMFHNIIKRPLFENLPYMMQKRVNRYLSFNWNRFFVHNWNLVIISIIVGAFSHLFLDSFTKEGGFFATRIPGLQDFVQIPKRLMTVSSILSFILSAVGVLIIAWSIYQIPPSKRVRLHRGNYLYWIVLFLLTIGISVFCFYKLIEPEVWQFYYLYYGSLAIILTSSFFLSLIITSLIFKFTRLKQSS
jgi:hypothetical protein